MALEPVTETMRPMERSAGAACRDVCGIESWKSAVSLTALFLN
jgi:hypothetical protein